MSFVADSPGSRENGYSGKTSNITLFAKAPSLSILKFTSTCFPGSTGSGSWLVMLTVMLGDSLEYCALTATLNTNATIIIAIIPVFIFITCSYEILLLCRPSKIQSSLQLLKDFDHESPSQLFF